MFSSPFTLFDRCLLFAFISLEVVMIPQNYVCSNDVILPKVEEQIQDIEDRRLDFTPVTDKVATLEMLANVAESNFSKLRTWRGRYIFQDTLFYEGKAADIYRQTSHLDSLPDKFSQASGGYFDFILDIKNKNIYVSHNVDRVLLRSNSPQIRIESPVENKFSLVSVVTPEIYLNFKPNINQGLFVEFSEKNQPTGRAAFIDPPQKVEMLTDTVSTNPSHFFRIGNRMLWEELRMYADILKKPDDPYIKSGAVTISVLQEISNTGVFKIILSTKSDQTNVIRNLILDGDAAFNIVKLADYIVDKSGKLTADIICVQNYTKLNNVFVPSIRSNSRPGAYSRFLRLSEADVNPSVTSDSFTYKNIGLSDGDRVVDRINNKLYIYEKGVLNEARDASAKIQPNQHFWIRLILVCVGLLLIFISIYQKMKNRYRGR